MFRSKQSRLLCLLFVLILCFQSFGLGVSASDSENLIDSDLRNWENFDTNTCIVRPNFGFYELYYIRHELADTGKYVRDGLIYDLTSLSAGNSYTLSFFLPSPEQVRTASNGLFTTPDDAYYDPFVRLDATLLIGLRDEATGEIYEDVCFLINKDNYLDYFGKNLEITFEMPNAKNPSIVIYYFDINSSGKNISLFFDDFSLIDNEQAKEDSFFSRLFEWFQKKFDAIGESFTNLGNKLTELKDGFINKITELKTSFENKITDLKESFQAKIDELKQGLIDLKDSLIEGIKSLFVPDDQAILDYKESLNTLLKNHLGIIYTCSDLLTDTLNLAFDIIFDAPDTYEIKIPEVSFEAAGTTVPVFSAQSIDFSFMEKPVFKTMYSMYTVAMYIFFGALEVKYALRVYRKVMNN